MWYGGGWSGNTWSSAGGNSSRAADPAGPPKALGWKDEGRGCPLLSDAFRPATARPALLEGN
jgi:hypothetical protein